jgi:NhaC family Na+:H+ antiporter
VPALGVALLLFLLVGLGAEAQTDATELASTLATLEQNYSIGIHMLLPLALLLFLAWKRLPALPAILGAAAVGAVYAWLFRPASAANELPALAQLWLLSVNGYTATTGDPLLDALLSGGGAAGMLNTLWLILSAVFFGSAMEKTGLLQQVLKVILAGVHNVAGLITATVLTCIGTNIITGDQYIAIVLPGRMYKMVFRDYRLAPVNLSRALEDSATVTSPLVPWNTCGAYMAATLGVATLAYLPYCFFNLVMPLLSIAYGLLGFRILPLAPVPSES